MKTLLILRHAKSSWDYSDLDDIDRPLNKRGYRDAPKVGLLLMEKELIPEYILCSPAKRARETAEAVAKACQYSGEIIVDGNLYPGNPAAYMDAIQILPEEADPIMIVSHNPGLEEFITFLTGESVRFPTAALAQLSVSIDSWTEIYLNPPVDLTNLWLVKELD
jgi:phosphohistidine phosphatase